MEEQDKLYKQQTEETRRRYSEQHGLDQRRSTFLAWKLERHNAVELRLKAQLQRQRVAVSVLLPQVQSLRLDLASLKQFAAGLAPVRAIPIAITQACNQMVRERDLVYGYCESLTIASQDKSAQLHQLHDDIAALQSHCLREQRDGAERRIAELVQSQYFSQPCATMYVKSHRVV
ncbi:hypothetical protein ACHHYP_20339 [Achlya hypogyna]|uniref:Uncharacterized protein n=1 Tax=Achlya hypogyna TaxID=1202772 RepID=A0A1V9YQJ5_ACHHY|nr:hypothetical protein ACHHYP_20339 [Achlya hypogyna]